MQRALSVREARFLSLCLFILILLQTGCTASLFSTELVKTEDNLSMGKTVGGKMKMMPSVTPPSVKARHTIAMAVDSALSDKYDEDESAELRKSLAQIRKDVLLPHYINVEAGYVLELLEKIEGCKRQVRVTSQQKEKLESENGKLTAESDKMKKELEELQYKIEKIEEIHINTEKKRGKQ